ncbi:hypothetical protein H180DRAFT_05656 [Streptomyces sp. WMMB 322]|nr:hypothetical protein H180DRAFT_05656 [Streptomyces sp. WMMB 322]
MWLPGPAGGQALFGGMDPPGFQEGLRVLATVNVLDLREAEQAEQ